MVVTSSHHSSQAEGTMAQQRAIEDGELGGGGRKIGFTAELLLGVS